jgi:2-methylisocitrate lyase-like PEP mutase family enzyme
MKDPKIRREELRKRLTDRRILVVPGTGDALGARLIERAGFEAVYISGFAVEGTHGLPDVGLLSMSQIADRAAQIVSSVNLPVFCDCDTGYGGIPNLIQTVREFERAGVAAVQFEDQAIPKKCGSMAGKKLVSPEEMVGKIRAACDTRRDPNLLVIGRTDAVSIEGLDAAIDRLSRYAEAGADLVMVLGPYDRSAVDRLAKAARRPLVYLNSESLTMPMIPAKELEAMGIQIVAFPISLLLGATAAMERTLKAIRERGTTLDIIESSMVTWSEFNQIVGLPAIAESDNRYSV